MNVVLNGTSREVADTATVADLVLHAGIERDEQGVAVAVDAAVVPRSQWSVTPVAPGARIEIVRATAGG